MLRVVELFCSYCRSSEDVGKKGGRMPRKVLRGRWDFSIHSTANMLNVLDSVVIILDAHSLKYLDIYSGNW